MKKIFLATIVFLFATSTNAFAHTHLGSSSPQDGEVVTEELREITLNFEGKIEKSSSFQLSDAKGQAIPVDVSINEGIMTGTFADSLENGEYSVKWSIFGADGHLMEGDYSFTVNMPESDAASETTTEPTQVEQETNQEPEQNSAQATSEQVEELESDEGNSALVPVIVIVLFVIVLGAFFVLRRKK